MAFKLVNRARMSVSGTPGTGVISVLAATTGFQSFSAAGLNNGDTFPYVIEDGTNWEYGIATWASSGTVTRTTIEGSSAGGTTAISVSSSAIVYCGALATNFQLAYLNDVNVTEGSGIDGYVLTYQNSSGKWIASAAASGNIAGLTDVALSSPTNGQALVYNSSTSKWVNSTVSGGGGGGGITPLYESSTTTYVLSTAPTSPTVVPDMTLTTVASTTTTEWSVSAQVAWDSGSHNMRMAIMVDGTIVWPNSTSSNGVDAITSGDGYYTGSLSGIAVSIPGDGATHTISLCWAASSSTSGFTIQGRSIIAIPLVAGGSGGSNTLSTLSDVNVTEGSAINYKCLRWDEATLKWIPQQTPVIVQYAAAVGNGIESVTLGAAPTEGNLLIAVTINSNPGTGTGWTRIAVPSGYSGGNTIGLLIKLAGSGESATQTPNIYSSTACGVAVFEISGANLDWFNAGTYQAFNAASTATSGFTSYGHVGALALFMCGANGAGTWSFSNGTIDEQATMTGCSIAIGHVVLSEQIQVNDATISATPSNFFGGYIILPVA